MTSEYSRRCLMKVVHIISRDFLTSLNLSLRIVLIGPHALSVMYFMWLCHVQSAEKITPRCLRDSTSTICWFSTKRGECKGLFSLRENISDSVFIGLNSTNQVATQCGSSSKLVLRQAAAITGFSTIIERLVSSANKCDISTYVIDYVVDVEKEK